MPADFVVPSPDFDKCPKSASAEMGHFGTFWGIDHYGLGD
jgi:hypothetical protein